MQLPKKSAAYGRRVDFGTYTTRSLRRARQTDLADGFEAATEAVLVAGRAWDDARRATFAARADRDAADADLDRVAQELRLSLASRALGAEKAAPYIHIFPRGIRWYTAAPLSQEIDRYSELVARLEKHLEADDPARAPAIEGLQAGLTAYRTAVDDLAESRRDQALAATDVDAAEEAFDLLAERTHGSLIAQLGRREARRFFPPAARSTPADAPEAPTE